MVPCSLARGLVPVCVCVHDDDETVIKDFLRWPQFWARVFFIKLHVHTYHCHNGLSRAHTGTVWRLQWIDAQQLPWRFTRSTICHNADTSWNWEKVPTPSTRCKLHFARISIGGLEEPCPHLLLYTSALQWGKHMWSVSTAGLEKEMVSAWHAWSCSNLRRWDLKIRWPCLVGIVIELSGDEFKMFLEWQLRMSLKFCVCSIAPLHALVAGAVVAFGSGRLSSPELLCVSHSKPYHTVFFLYCGWYYVCMKKWIQPAKSLNSSSAIRALYFVATAIQFLLLSSTHHLIIFWSHIGEMVVPVWQWLPFWLWQIAVKNRELLSGLDNLPSLNWKGNHVAQCDLRTHTLSQWRCTMKSATIFLKWQN